MSDEKPARERRGGAVGLPVEAPFGVRREAQVSNERLHARHRSRPVSPESGGAERSTLQGP